VCGICGVIQIGGTPRPVIPPEVLDGMTDAMTHRGPNDRGTYADEGVALGVRRLSIVDVEGGHQPFASEDGRVWAIQNGELYNHGDVRRELESAGHRFTSRCDTEVIPHLYERDGVAFVERLRGKFGLALWDGGRRRAVLARDRLGVKPLYYARSGDLLVFASELKSLLASGLVPVELDYEAIDVYLSFGFVPGPLTPLAGVHKLLPGHRLVVDPSGVRTEPYWTYPQPDPGDPALGVEHYGRGLMEQLDEAVRLRLMSDVPLGAMLSGGIDSSLIVALMARHMSEPVKTFSIGFVEAGETSELADARLVADAFGTDHHELELSFNEQAIDLAELVWSLDEPLAELSALGFHALSELAARHVTVALSGQGADELLGGYLKHQAAALCARWSKMPRGVRALGGRAAPLARGRLERAARTLTAPDAASRLVAMSSKLDDELRRGVVRGPLAELDGTGSRRAVERLLGGLADDDPLATTLYLDAQLALVDTMLHYFDRTSMAHSLEVRVPFLDHSVVEYCATIPSTFKVHGLGLRRKHVLKEAVRGVIPDRIIDKPKLGFFRQETDAWFRAQTRGAVADYLLGPAPAYAEFLDRGAVERLVRAHADGNGRHPHLLLSILMLEVWLSTFVPRALASRAPARERIRLSA
jgi:asparagine synthase (glutamine-hydrolysing)